MAFGRDSNRRLSGGSSGSDDETSVEDFENRARDRQNNNSADEVRTGGNPDRDGDGVTDSGYRSPDRDSGSDDDDPVFRTPSERGPRTSGGEPSIPRSGGTSGGGAPPSGSSSSGGSSSGGSSSGGSTDLFDPTSPDSPGGTTVGSGETERLLREAREAGATLEDVDENGALAAQLERATGVDPRRLASERGGRDRADVDLDAEAGVFRTSYLEEMNQETRRQQRQRREGITQDEGRNALEGLGVGSGFGTGRQTSSYSIEGGDVRLLNESSRPGLEGGDARLFTVSGPDVQQDAVSQLIEDFEGFTGLDIPGEGRATSPRRRDRERFGDFQGGVLGDLDDWASDLEEDVFGGVDDTFSDENRQTVNDLDTVPQIPGATVITPGGLGSGRSGDFIEGSTAGGLGILGGIPSTTIEAAEFGVEAGEQTLAGNGGEFFDDAAQEATNRLVETSEFGLTNPEEFSGMLFGGATTSAGAIGTASRLGGARAGRAVSFGVQPGEELAVTAARSGLISDRAASLVPGVSRTRAGAEDFFGDTRGQASLGTTSTRGATQADEFSFDFDELDAELSRMERAQSGDVLDDTARRRRRNRTPGEGSGPPSTRYRPDEDYGYTPTDDLRRVSDLEQELADDLGVRVDEDVFTPSGLRVNEVRAGGVLGGGLAGFDAVSGARSRQSSAQATAVEQDNLFGTGGDLLDPRADADALQDVFTDTRTDVRTETGTDIFTETETGFDVFTETGTETRTETRTEPGREFGREVFEPTTEFGFETGFEPSGELNPPRDDPFVLDDDAFGFDASEDLFSSGIQSSEDLIADFYGDSGGRDRRRGRQADGLFGGGDFSGFDGLGGSSSGSSGDLFDIGDGWGF